MWSQVGVNDSAELAECAQLFNEGNVGIGETDVPTLRTAIASGIARLFLYSASGLKLTAYVQNSPKRDRHILCTAFQGGQPSAVLDLLITQIKQFATQHGLSAVYGIYPLSMPDTPLKQLYDLAPLDARLQVTTVTTTSDAKIWKIEAV